MNMEITEGLTVTERRNQKGENHYSRYLPSFFIDDDCFSSAIKRLGGVAGMEDAGEIRVT